MNIHVCPSCKSELDFRDSAIGKIKCKNKNCLYFNDFFVIQQSIPILIPFKDKYCILKNTTKDQKKNFGDKRRTSKKYNFLRNKFLKNIRTLLIGENKISKRNYKFLSMALKKQQRILIIGGGTRGEGSKEFYRKCSELKIDLDVLDIYFSNECNVIADAHYLPYSENYFDFVIVQAVLEHVAFPRKVVNEINRVLKINGFVYSEIPFIQNVHEGAFDFTRFTHSGHRLLFKEFDEIKSGYSQGAFSSMLFIMSNTLASFFRLRILGPFMRLLLTRLAKFLDNSLSYQGNIDLACGTYLICKKVSKKEISKNYKWIIDYYKGSQI